MTLAGEDNNPILANDANRVILGKVTIRVYKKRGKTEKNYEKLRKLRNKTEKKKRNLREKKT